MLCNQDTLTWFVSKSAMSVPLLTSDHGLPPHSNLCPPIWAFHPPSFVMSLFSNYSDQTATLHGWCSPGLPMHSDLLWVYAHACAIGLLPLPSFYPPIWASPPCSLCYSYPNRITAYCCPAAQMGQPLPACAPRSAVGLCTCMRR